MTMTPLDTLIAAREKCARLIIQRGDIYLPIFERLDREIETLQAREAAMAKVHAIAAKTGTQNGTLYGTQSGHHDPMATPCL